MQFIVIFKVFQSEFKVTKWNALRLHTGEFKLYEIIPMVKINTVSYFYLDWFKRTNSNINKMKKRANLAKSLGGFTPEVCT